ncbi:hypothetical protein [Arthrobacter sp. C152]
MASAEELSARSEVTSSTFRRDLANFGADFASSNHAKRDRIPVSGSAASG